MVESKGKLRYFTALELYKEDSPDDEYYIGIEVDEDNRDIDYELFRRDDSGLDSQSYFFDRDHDEDENDSIDFEYLTVGWLFIPMSDLINIDPRRKKKILSKTKIIL